MKMHLLSFATSNWKRAQDRILSQSEVAKNKYGIFDTISFLTEKDLGPDYTGTFGQYVSDPGYAYWSWKPYIMLKRLNEIPYGDSLLYIDGGCTLPDNISMFRIMNNTALNLRKYELPIAVGQTNSITPVMIQIRKQVLDSFGLSDDKYFLYGFPHYECGMMILYKNDATVDFISRWYCFIRDNYVSKIRSERYDRTGQLDGYWRNGGDQQVFHCMLYKENKMFCDLWNFWYKYGICTRIQG